MDLWSYVGPLGVLGLYWPGCFQDCYQKSGWVHRGCDIIHQLYNITHPGEWLRHLRMQRKKCSGVVTKSQKTGLARQWVRNSNTSCQPKTLVLLGREGLRQITNYKPKASHSINDLHPANKLNKFYCCFVRQRNSNLSDSIHQLQPTSSTSVGTWASP